MKNITEKLFKYLYREPPNLNRIKEFIEQGAELDKVNNLFNDDLISLIIRGTKSKRERLAIVQLMIEAGAKLNYSITSKRSPVGCAIDALDYKVVKLLLENGAIVHPKQDLYGSMMIQKDNIKIFKLLLEHGLDVNAPSSNAYMGGADNDILIKGNSLLMDAVQADALEIVKCLLKTNADIHYSHYFSGSALVQAVKKNRIDATELLLQAGCDPNEKVLPGNKPALRFAICRGNIECAKLLLQHGAEIDGAYFEEDLDNLNIPREVAEEIKVLMTT